MVVPPVESRNSRSTPGEESRCTVRFINVNTVESKKGDLVVVNRNGKLVVVDPRRARAGALHVDLWLTRLLTFAKATRSKLDRELVEWDPFTSSVLTEIAGKAGFHDIVEGENLREETDPVTGLSQRIIVDTPLTPTSVRRR